MSVFEMQILLLLDTSILRISNTRWLMRWRQKISSKDQTASCVPHQGRAPLSPQVTEEVTSDCNNQQQMSRRRKTLRGAQEVARVGTCLERVFLGERGVPGLFFRGLGWQPCCFPVLFPGEGLRSTRDRQSLWKRHILLELPVFFSHRGWFNTISWPQHYEVLSGISVVNELSAQTQSGCFMSLWGYLYGFSIFKSEKLL